MTFFDYIERRQYEFAMALLVNFLALVWGASIFHQVAPDDDIQMDIQAAHILGIPGAMTDPNFKLPPLPYQNKE